MEVEASPGELLHLSDAVWEWFSKALWNQKTDQRRQYCEGPYQDVGQGHGVAPCGIKPRVVGRKSTCLMQWNKRVRGCFVSSFLNTGWVATVKVATQDKLKAWCNNVIK